MESNAELTRLRRRIVEQNAASEERVTAWLLEEARLRPGDLQQTRQLAMRLAQGVREARLSSGGIDLLLQEFSPDSRDGRALMSLSEAMLRIPDRDTRNRLICDKVVGGQWRAHLGKSPSAFVNLATRCLITADSLLAPHRAPMIRTLAQTAVRIGVAQIMKLLAKQFVVGATVAAAIRAAQRREERGYRYSYDMLGEGAVTAADAQAYFDAYREAIECIGRTARGSNIIDRPGVSIKLTGLHPRYEWSQRQRVMDEMYPRLLLLAQAARKSNIGLHIDQEDAIRFDLTLNILERLMGEPTLHEWGGLGISLQSYQKRGRAAADWLIALARQHRRKLMVRLVKGAYWDTDIKRCLAAGDDNFPEFTRKVHSDVSYIACAKALLSAPDAIFPQFATHNAYTIAAIHTIAGTAEYEFQCLHGMGETVYDQVVGQQNLGRACRVYAPVGPHDALLAYLVRRLLENGTNSSFVKQITDPSVSIAELAEDPVTVAARTGGTTQPPELTPSYIVPARSQGRTVADCADGAITAIADSSSLPEQVVMDAVSSAFDGHAGKQGSLKLLCVQDAVAGKVIGMIEGAMQERVVGLLAGDATDVGPLLDAQAKSRFEQHVVSVRKAGARIVQSAHGKVPEGNFVPPTLIELGGVETLQSFEPTVFGPVLHVVRWRSEEFARLIELIDRHVRPPALSVYTRIDENIDAVVSATQVAAVFVNDPVAPVAVPRAVTSRVAVI